VHAPKRLKFERHFWIVCKGVKQSLTRTAARASIGAARPIISGLAKQDQADTSRIVQVSLGFARPLVPNLYRSVEKRLGPARLRHWKSMSEMNAAGAGLQSSSLGDEIVGRINQLATISETPAHLTRIFLTKEHCAAADLILSWMREAGMHAHLDAIGNVCGRYEGEVTGLPCLMLGSHYDTVRDAGKWDGPLGLITAISCVADLHKRGRRLPFAIEVTGFADEEGVRFASTLLGSRAVAGRFDESALGAKDSTGISMRDALSQFGLDPDHIGAAARARSELLGYVELHIEQGPVLEGLNLPVGVVTAIAGATRLAASLTGMAGHAGTVPMPLRRDALAGAAEAMVALERAVRDSASGTTVGTVGVIRALPGAINVVPGIAELDVDVRDSDVVARGAVVEQILGAARAIAAARDLELTVDEIVVDTPVACDPAVIAASEAACAELGLPYRRMISGAYHDAMIMGRRVPVGMIFVPSAGGVSHHPDEYTAPEELDRGVAVLAGTLARLAG
jgi:allantoate deiminase